MGVLVLVGESELSGPVWLIYPGSGELSDVPLESLGVPAIVQWVCVLLMQAYCREVETSPGEWHQRDLGTGVGGTGK